MLPVTLRHAAGGVTLDMSFNAFPDEGTVARRNSFEHSKRYVYTERCITLLPHFVKRANNSLTTPSLRCALHFYKCFPVTVIISYSV